MNSPLPELIYNTSTIPHECFAKWPCLCNMIVVFPIHTIICICKSRNIYIVMPKCQANLYNTSRVFCKMAMPMQYDSGITYSYYNMYLQRPQYLYRNDKMSSKSITASIQYLTSVLQNGHAYAI